jgi:hypothetical protein
MCAAALPRRDVLAAARVALVDRTTARVVVALRSAHVRSIVLKGPAFARCLYDDGTLRPYGDTDLLIPAADIARAGKVLESMDYLPTFTDADFPPFNRELHAHSWSCANRPAVDLHHTLDGATASPSVVWTALSHDTETIELSGTTVEILGIPAQAVQAALHVAAHGAAFPGPLEDLGRALERIGPTSWITAADLASDLGAIESFTAGLSLLPAGRRLASDLNLPASTSVEVNLRASPSPRLALHLEWLSQASGIRAKFALAWRLLLPPRAFMQAHLGPGPHPRRALARAYLARLLRLPRHAPAAVIAWRRTHRPH